MTPPGPRRGRLRPAARLALRSALDGLLFAAAGGLLAVVLGLLAGGEVHALGAAVAAAWLGAGAGLGSCLGPDERRAALGALLLGLLGAVAGLVNGAYADGLVAAGSIDGGLSGVHEALDRTARWPACAWPVLAAMPCVLAALRSRRGGGERVEAGLLVPALLLLGLAAVVLAVAEGPGSRAVRGLVAIGLGLAAWCGGPALLYGLGDRVLPVEPRRDLRAEPGQRPPPSATDPGGCSTCLGADRRSAP